MSKQLTSYHVETYRDFILNVKSIKSKGENNLAPNTIASYYSKFINVLKKAHKKKLLTTNLAEDAEYIKEEETIREYLNEEELQVLWKTPVKLPVLKTIAFFSIMTGLRFSDIKNLEWEKIFKDPSQGYYIRLKELKTGNKYNHYIPANAYKLLPQKSEGKIFPNLKYSQITRPLDKWIKETEINKHITFHNFRHTFATLQLSKGTDIYTLSKMLGHKGVITTQIYGKVIDKQKIEASNRMNLNLDGF
jgi:integrase